MARLFILLCLLGCGDPGWTPKHAPCESFKGLHLNALAHNDFGSNADGNCDNVIVALSSVECPAIAFLYGTFGSNYSCLDRVLDSIKDRDHLVEIYASNETCRRNKNCDTGEVLGTLTPDQINREIERGNPQIIGPFAKRFQDVKELIKRFPLNTTVYVAPGLEDQFTDRAFSTLSQLARNILPTDVKLSSSTVFRTTKQSADVQEEHGQDARCADDVKFVSQDGDLSNESLDRSFHSRSGECVASFLWRPEWQGRESTAPATQVPTARHPRFTETDATETNAILTSAVCAVS